jgi:hypothetical protein
VPHKARGSLACQGLCWGLASLSCVFPGVRCCDVRVCSRLCVCTPFVGGAVLYARAYASVSVMCAPWYAASAWCVWALVAVQVRARVPWFVLCMIPAWVRTLPVVVCVARRVAVPSGSGSPACAGGGGSPSCRRGVYGFGSASAGSQWTPAMACGRCVPEACVSTTISNASLLVVKPAPHEPCTVLNRASVPCGS